MGKTLQEELLGKGIVKGTSFNKAMSNPFSDKSQLNRFGKPVRWRIWLKGTSYPDNIGKVCCLCGRKVPERDRDKLVEDFELFTEIFEAFARRRKIYPMLVALTCPTCNEIRQKNKKKEHKDGSSD